MSIFTDPKLQEELDAGFEEIDQINEERPFKKKKEEDAQSKAEKKKYEFRIKLVALSHGRPDKFLEEIHNNEDYIRKTFTQAEKECLRRNTCERVIDFATIEDLEFINCLFGYYIDPRQSTTIPTQGTTSCCEPKKTFLETMNEFKFGSYHYWWDWVHRESVILTLIDHPEYLNELIKAIDYAKQKNLVYDIRNVEMAYGGKPKSYEQSDDAYYEQLIKSIATGKRSI